MENTQDYGIDEYWDVPGGIGIIATDGSQFWGSFQDNGNMTINITTPNGTPYTATGWINFDEYGNPQSYSVYGSDGNGGTNFFNWDYFN